MKSILCKIVPAVFLLIAGNVLAQQPQDIIYDRHLQENGDTILTERTYGNWWFGVSGSAAYSYYFGQLSLPRIPSRQQSDIVDFASGNGAGYSIGGVIEWKPRDQNWGFALAARGLDLRTTRAIVEPGFQNIKEVRSDVTYTYAGIAPSFRYNLPFANIHALIGMNIDYLMAHTSTIEQVQYNYERIDEVRINPLKPNTLKLGGHVGFGADILAGEFSRNARLEINPYILVEYGSSATAINNSSWQNISARAGLALKIGFDNQTKTLLPYDSSHIVPVNAIALGRTERGLFMEGQQDTMLIADLAYLGGSVHEDVSPPATVQVIERVPKTLPPVHPKVVTKFEINKPRSFNNLSSTSYSVTKDLQSYLDGMVTFLKANPGTRVHIEGHSDNIGTIQETQKKSDERAEAVVRYLMGKGIPRYRLFASGLGSRRPLADNRTESGRQQNRRVEVRIVQ